MRVIYGIKKIKKPFKRPVVTIGIFDGLHLGHRSIIRRLTDKAKRIKTNSIVLTFKPHPINVLQLKKQIPLLISVEQRIKMFKNLGVDICIIEKFSRDFSKLSPRDFIKELLIKRIHPKEVVVGRGFRFGKRASGGIKLLREIGRLHDFSVKEVSPIKIGKEVVSSTSIRKLIQNGYLKKASKFLGKNVSVSGKVIKGKGKGRILGFPTANIYPCAEVIPPDGIYATKVNFNRKEFSSMTFIESLPTTDKRNKAEKSIIEVHIFNFNKVIYGKHISIDFLKKIRNKKKFISQTDLREQLKKDEKAVKLFLKAYRKK